MLAKFSREHWHDEDEVRFIIEGRGLFHVHPPDGPVFAIEVEAGDLIRVPRGTHHWFDLCADRRIRAIRLFQDPSGWTPHYTDTGIDQGFQPVCFGPSYLTPAVRAHVSVRRVRRRARRFCSTSKARRRRSRSSSTCCSRMRAHICGATSSSMRPRPTYARLLEQLREEHASGSRGWRARARVGRRACGRAPRLGRQLPRVADGSRPQVDRAERPAGQDLGGGLPPRRADGRGLRRCAAAPSSAGARRACDRDLLLGKRPCPAAALPPLVGRAISPRYLRWHFDTTDRREEPTRTAIAASPRR